MEVHEAANIFPMCEEDLQSLADDIKQCGQRVPIELLDGKIIDGRRREAACKMAGVEPLTRDVVVPDPVAYVLSINLHRRHLTPSQRAMVGARARECYDRAAKERKREGGKVAGKGRPKQDVEKVPQPNVGKSRDHVGKAVGVSGRLIDFATAALKDAVPEVVKLVDEGKMSVKTAAQIASEPEAVQQQQAEQWGTDYKKAEAESKAAEPDSKPDEPQQIKRLGVGVERGHEAINALMRIPKTDPLRQRGFQIVMDYIKANK